MIKEIPVDVRKLNYNAVNRNLYVFHVQSPTEIFNEFRTILEGKVASLTTLPYLYILTGRHQISFLYRNHLVASVSCVVDKVLYLDNTFTIVVVLSILKGVKVSSSPSLSPQDNLQLRVNLNKPQESEHNKKQVNHGGI